MRLLRPSFCLLMLLGIAYVTPVRAGGALAHGDDGRVGISYDFDHERAAEDRALAECGGRCRVVATFRNSCAAIAVGRGGGFGWASRERMAWADHAAIENCAAEGNRGCTIEAHGCDGD